MIPYAPYILILNEFWYLIEINGNFNNFLSKINAKILQKMYKKFKKINFIYLLKIKFEEYYLFTYYTLLFY